MNPLKIVYMATSSLSLLALLIADIILIISKDFSIAKYFSSRLQFYLYISMTILYIFIITGIVFSFDDHTCQIIAPLKMINELLSLCTIAYISWTLLWSVLDIQYNFGNQKFNPISNEKIFFTCAVIFSFAICYLPFSTDSIGQRGTDCWIKSNTKMDFVWEWIDYLIPVILVLSWNLGCVIYAIQVLKRFRKQRKLNRMLAMKLCQFPFIMIFGYLIDTIVVIYEGFDSQLGDTSPWRFIAKSCMGLQGVLYVLLFAFSNPVQFAI